MLQLCQNDTQTHIVHVNMSRIKSVGMPQQVQKGRDWDWEWQDITAHYSHNLLALLSAILSKHVSDFKCACGTLLFYRAYVCTLRSHTLYYKFGYCNPKTKHISTLSKQCVYINYIAYNNIYIYGIRCLLIHLHPHIVIGLTLQQPKSASHWGKHVHLHWTHASTLSIERKILKKWMTWYARMKKSKIWKSVNLTACRNPRSSRKNHLE